MNLHKLLSFEQGRIKFFETLTKYPENWQQNPTPLDIVRKMVDKTSLDDKKILVLFNIEFLQVLVEERKINPKNIYYIADNDLEYLSGIKIFKVQSYQIKEYTVPALKKLIAGLEMKFDVVFSNPPYNGNIDIKILNEIIDIADEFVVVHPSTWLIDRQNLSQIYVQFKSKIKNKSKSFELFNGNPIFDIKLMVPCLITHIDKNHNGMASVSSFEEIYDSEIEDISIFGSKYKNLVKPFMITLLQNETLKTTYSMDKEFKVQLAVIRGNVEHKNIKKIVKDDFYTIVMQNTDENKGIRLAMNRNDDARLVFSFGSELEQNNFLSYLKTDFARFCLSLYKVHSNQRAGALNLIPWLDFTEEWDDEKLFKKFDVSQELQDYIRDFLPDYYGIRK